MLIKKEIKCKDDEFTHLYTLIVKPDKTYEVHIDNEKTEWGKLEDDFDLLPPKKIKDPKAKKPKVKIRKGFLLNFTRPRSKTVCVIVDRTLGLAR